MKLLVFLFCVFASLSLQAKTLIVGVSPFWDKASHQQQFMEVMQFATGLEVGDSVHVIDAFHLKPLGEFIIPEGRAYQNPKARLQKNGKLVAQFKKLQRDREGITEVNGAVRLPHFLRYVAEFYRDMPDKTIVIIGSPFFDDVKEQGYSMKDGFFPNDSHIAANIKDSIWGTKNLNTLLDGWHIHFATSNSEMNSSRHEYYIKRFVTLYVEGLGGSLATFTDDVSFVLNRAYKKVLPQAHDYQLAPTERLQMLRLRIGDAQVPIHNRSLSLTPPSDAVLKEANNVQISAIWDWGCACDIDLYARGAPHKEILSFQKKQTDEGWYFKDIQNQDKGVSTYETIEFYRPINLHDTQIALVFYGGNVPHSVTGSLRIAIGDATYAMPFTINAKQGLGTQSVAASFQANKATAKHIVMIDPVAVIQP